MKVNLIPLSGAKGRKPIAVPFLPVMLTGRSRRQQAHDVPAECRCEIQEQDGLLAVKDRGPDGGICINGRRIRESYVWPGDALTIGNSSFLVSYKVVNGESRRPRPARALPIAPLWSEAADNGSQALPAPGAAVLTAVP